MFIALSLILNSSFSQTFDGIAIDGDLSTAIAKYKLKGYLVEKYFDGGVILNGEVLGAKIELYIFTTIKTKKVFKAVVYLPRRQSWFTLKNEYEKYFVTFTDKYGMEDSKYEFFTSPYFEGDGYELQALKLEKATFAGYWFNKNNTTIALEISEYQQVKITYENDRNQVIAKREIDAVKNSTF